MVSYSLRTVLGLGVLALTCCIKISECQEFVEDPLVVCYFSSWAVYRAQHGDGKGAFDVDSSRGYPGIPPNLCTHIVYGFTGLSNQTWEIEVLDPWNELCADDPHCADYDHGPCNHCAFQRFIALKKDNPELVATVAVGGWNEGSAEYSLMAGDPQKRQTFVDSVCVLLERYHFDGLDVDWEYPAARGGAPEDKENFGILLDMLRARFDQYQPAMIITGALAAGRQNVDTSYDPAALQRNMDFFHIMAYDYHGAFENFTHHNAPLCQYYQDEGNTTWFNVEYTIKYYLSLGFAPEKIAMGIPTYGRCWTLDDPDQNGMLAPANKPSPGGDYTMSPGSLGFNEICSRFTTNKTEGDCTIVHDPDMHEPYFYCKSDNIWCGYDDGDSIYLKAKMARNLGLGGVMVWTIDTDDFLGECYDETFHLIEHAKDPWREPIDTEYEACAPHSDTTTSGPSTSSSAATTTASSTTSAPTSSAATTTASSTASAPTSSAATTTASSTTSALTSSEPTGSTESSASTASESTTTPEITTSSAATSSPTTPSPTESTTPGGPCPPDYGSAPNCHMEPEGSVFPHTDCIKYWECEYGTSTIKLCSPGTVFDSAISECNWQNAVDTTCCRLWDCALDNTYFPAADCDKYYRCYNGAPHLEQCANCLFWNQGLFMCDQPAHVDISHCTIPDYC